MNSDKTKKVRIINLLKKILPFIGIIIFIIILYFVGIENVYSTFFKMSPLLLAIILGLSIPVMLLNNYIWQLILRKQKIKISFFKSLKIQLIGRFYSIVTPARLGIYAKILYLKEEVNEPTGKLFVNLLIQMAIDGVAYYLFLVVAAIMYASEHFEIFLFVIIYVTLMISIYIYFIKKERGEKVVNFLIKIFIPKKFKKYFLKFSLSFYDDFPKIKHLIFPFSLSLIIQLMEYTQIYLIAIALGINVPFPLFIVLYTIAAIIASIPSFAGGLGTKEAALILLFAPFGIEAYKLVAFSISNYILFGLLIGFIGFILALIDARGTKKLLKFKDLTFNS